MPDVDSVETQNRSMVEAWLPCVDWIVYVVNPERYRDDVGWQLLRARADRHHWLFVMNQCDLGTVEQKGDFQRVLAEAGFEAPTVLGTSCLGDSKDDFPQLEAIVDAAIAEHGLAELQRLGVLARIRDLDQLAADLARQLGSEQDLAAFIARHRSHCAHLAENLLEDLRWPIRLLANQFPGPRRLWSWRRSDPPGPAPDQLPELVGALWSDQASRQLQDMVASASVDAHDAGLPMRPAERVVAKAMDGARQRITDAMIEGLNRALARPGTRTQRGVRGGARLLLYLMPLAAAAWAGYHMLSRYQEALSGTAAFLGIDFAVHSVLLLGLMWLAPFLVYRLFEPCPRSDARRGLVSGARAGVARVAAGLEQAYTDLARERADLLARVPHAATRAAAAAVRWQ